MEDIQQHTIFVHFTCVYMMRGQKDTVQVGQQQSVVVLEVCLLVTQEIMARLDTRGEVEGGARRVRHIHMLLVPAILLFFISVPTSSQSEKWDRRR